MTNQQPSDESIKEALVDVLKYYHIGTSGVSNGFTYVYIGRDEAEGIANELLPVFRTAVAQEVVKTLEAIPRTINDRGYGYVAEQDIDQLITEYQIKAGSK